MNKKRLDFRGGNSPLGVFPVFRKKAIFFFFTLIHFFRDESLQRFVLSYLFPSFFLFYFIFTKKDGAIFVDPSPYTINLLIAYDENTFLQNPLQTEGMNKTYNILKKKKDRRLLSLEVLQYRYGGRYKVFFLFDLTITLKDKRE